MTSGHTRRTATVFGSVLLCAAAVVWAPDQLRPEGVERDFVGEYDLLRRRALNIVPLLRAADVDRAWASFSWLPEVMPVARYSPETNAALDEGLYRRAISIYEAAAVKAAKRTRKLNSLEKERLSLPGGPWWLRVDLGDALDREARRTKRRGARSLAVDYIRVLETLDSIRSGTLRESVRTRTLRQAALRRGAVERLLVGDTLSALKLLEQYRRDPGAEQEWPLHFHLARAYEATFRDARRDRGVSEGDLRRLRRRKNLHLLRAVELRYGLSSIQYDAVWKTVRLDELGGPRTP